MTRALAITQLHLRNLQTNVHGVYQRFRMILEALSASVDVIDVVCLDPKSDETAGMEDPDTERELFQHWGIGCRVVNGITLKVPPLRPWALEQLRWISSYRHSQPYLGVDNAINRGIWSELTLSPPDLVFAHKLPTMTFLSGLRLGSTPTVFDLDDVEHIAFARRIGDISDRRSRLVARAMVPSIRAAVGKAVKSATHTLVCSANDKHYLDGWLDLPNSRVLAVQNACPIHLKQAVALEPVLLFVGTLSWRPNAQAVEYFLEHIWPEILSVVPQARFVVVGRDPGLVDLNGKCVENVEFAGFVDDIASMYARARVVVCPVISGGGTRVKLVEAASFGKAIVSTSLGAEGLDFEDGRQAMLKDAPTTFAKASVQLLLEKELCEALSLNAHAHAIERFSRSLIISRMQSLFASVQTSGRK